MKITALSSQSSNPNRVNIFIDGKFELSLDLAQVVDFKLKIGLELNPTQLIELHQASQFGKVYARALEFCLRRPRSVGEVNDYLKRKSLPSKVRTRQGRIVERQGFDPKIIELLLQKLQQNGYVDDQKFTNWWLESRNLKKGISKRKLLAELRAKKVNPALIEQAMTKNLRDDSVEIAKIIAKKARRYPDKQKLFRYLVSQGFQYDDIRAALEIEE